MAHRVFSQELDFGELLKESLNLFKNNIVQILIMNIVIALPNLIYSLNYNISEFAIAMNPSIIVPYIIFALISMLGPIATIKIYHNDLFEEQSSYQDLFMFSLKRFFPYFVASLAYSIFTVFGFFLLIVPGVIIGVIYVFTTYIVVIRQFNNTIDAMKYSKELVKDNFGKTFGYIISAALILGVLAAVILVPMYAIGMLGMDVNFDPNNLQSMPPSPPLFTIVVTLVSIIGSSIMSALIYLLMVNYEAEKGYFIEEGNEGSTNQ